MKQKHWIILLSVIALIAVAAIVVLLLPRPAAPASAPDSEPQLEQQPEPEPKPEPESEPEPEPEPESEPEPEPEPDSEPEEPAHVVVLDPGHQGVGDNELEPNGPGSSEMKAKVSYGTRGSFTGLAEFDLTLQIGLALEQELLARGYEVYMTRHDNDVSISNAERAQYASEVGGEILVRIHANGSSDSSVSGALTICQTPNNPYQNRYEESRRLSDLILEKYCAACDIPMQYVWETDTMTGINWCEIPSTILEMGYMTNQSDDTKMADPEYQVDMVRGIADGIDAYFE